MDVVEELLGLLKDQTAINDKLVSTDTALVDKNISKSPSGSTFGKTPNPKLTSVEVRRTTEVSNIFIKSFFDAEKKYKPDNKEKTKISELKRQAEKSQTKMKVDPKGSSLWDSLLGAFGLGSAAWGLLKDKFGKFIAGLANKIKGFVGRIIKGLGSLWSKIKNSRIVKSLGRLISNIGKSIKGFIGRIVSKFKGMFSSLVGGIKKLISNIMKGIRRVISSIGKALRNIWGRITNSKAYKAFVGAIDTAMTAIKDFFTGLKNRLLELLKKAAEFAKNLIPTGVKDAAGKVVSTVASKGGGLWESVKSVGSKAVGAVKSGASAVGSAVVETGAKAGKYAVQGAKAVGNFALGPAKEAITNASRGIIKGSGGMFKLMGKLVKLPVIGPIIEGLLTAHDIKNLKERHAKGEISLEELQAQSGRRVVQGVSALGGSALGTFLGAAAGSIIPVAGNVVGGVLGAIGGDMLGRFVGGLLNDHILPPRYSKSIGAFVTGTTPPSNEMQDFIIKGNQVYPFSNKDEIMGMKNGGAIDNFLNSKQGNSGLSTLINTSNMANVLLQGIERNTREMIRALGGAGGSTTIQQSIVAPPPSEKQMVTAGNNRAGYSASPYSLA